MTDKLVPVSEAKGSLTGLVRESDVRDVVLLRHGRPAAVMLSHERYEALLEHCADMADRLSVHEADGMTMSYDALRAELNLGEEEAKAS